MNTKGRTLVLGALAACAALLTGLSAVQAVDPLPSWNDTVPKKALIAFVEKVTKEGSRDFVPPPEQVVGSQGKLRFELRDGRPVLVKLPAVQFVDDREGKAIGIQTFIGRRPIAAFGNSDGDLQMLQWTQAGDGLRLMVLVHHDDAGREWAYGAESKIGTFSGSLMGKAKQNGWTIISMKDDWKQVFRDGVGPESNAENGSRQEDICKTTPTRSSWHRPVGGAQAAAFIR